MTCPDVDGVRRELPTDADREQFDAALRGFLTLWRDKASAGHLPYSGPRSRHLVNSD